MWEGAIAFTIADMGASAHIGDNSDKLKGDKFGLNDALSAN